MAISGYEDLTPEAAVAERAGTLTEPVPDGADRAAGTEVETELELVRHADPQEQAQIPDVPAYLSEEGFSMALACLVANEPDDAVVTGQVGALLVAGLARALPDGWVRIDPEVAAVVRARDEAAGVLGIRFAQIGQGLLTALELLRSGAGVCTAAELTEQVSTAWRHYLHALGQGQAREVAEPMTQLIIWAVLQTQLTVGDVAAGEAATQVIADVRALLGDHDENALAVGGQLYGVLVTAGDVWQATLVLEWVVDGVRRVLGPGDPQTLAAQDALSAVRTDLELEHVAGLGRDAAPNAFAAVEVPVAQAPGELLRRLTGIDDDEGAQVLARVLNGRPALLAVAAASIVVRQLTFASYLHALPAGAAAASPVVRAVIDLAVIDLAVTTAARTCDRHDLDHVLGVLACAGPLGLRATSLAPLVPGGAADLTAAISAVQEVALVNWLEPDLLVMDPLVAGVLIARDGSAGRLGARLGALAQQVDALARGLGGATGVPRGVLVNLAHSLWEVQATALGRGQAMDSADSVARLVVNLTEETVRVDGLDEAMDVVARIAAQFHELLGAAHPGTLALEQWLAQDGHA